MNTEFLNPTMVRILLNQGDRAGAWSLYQKLPQTNSTPAAELRQTFENAADWQGFLAQMNDWLTKLSESKHGIW